MDSNYDEILTDNVFFQTLQKDYRDVFLKATIEGCVICIPREGSVPTYMLTLEDFFSHILIPSDELPESHFRTLNGKDVKINNRVITVEHDVGHQTSTHVLFDETFYSEDNLRYKVLCIEQPLEEKSDFSHCSSNIVVLRTLRDCMDLLWIESGSQAVIEKIDQAISEFLAANDGIETCCLQTIKDLTGLLYTKCVQIVLKDPRIKEKSNLQKHMVENFKIAVETYMHHGIYNKIMKGISTCTSYEDAKLNKITRNMSDIQFKDLGIRTELYNTLPRAKLELSKIDAYCTVLGKIGCLKKMLLAIFKQPSKRNILAADDLLPILVFLVIKTNLPNWHAQIMYLKSFRFSVSSDFQSDETCFLITSLEAAIEHIQSGIMMGSSIPESQGNDFEIMRTFDPDSSETKTISHFFLQICRGDLKEMKKVLETGRTQPSSYSEINLCHPLCSCPKCKGLISKNLCETVPTVKSCDDRGLTALHIASMYGQPQIIDYLLSHGADPNASDCNGSIPIHYAAMRGHQNALLLMVHAGADVNAADNSSNTPLHFGSNNGHEGCVKALVYFSEHVGITLDVNAQNYTGDTPLHHAARWGYVNIVKILLENRANPTILNKRKLSPIDQAHNLKVLSMLTSRFEEKVIENYIRIKDKAVHRLDFTDEQTDEVKTKNIITGIRPNSTELIKKVEKALRAIACGDVNLSCYYLGIDASDMQATSVLHNENGSDNGEKCHPLCRCRKCSETDKIADLSPEKPKTSLNINICNPEGLTPLHVAALYGRLDLARGFVKNGAWLNVQTRSKLLTPLMLACQNQRTQIVVLLLESRCNIDLQDCKGNTALHYACHTGNSRLVEMLVKYEPDTSLKNCHNKTALDEARDKMFLGLVKIIRGGQSLNINIL